MLNSITHVGGFEVSALVSIILVSVILGFALSLIYKYTSEESGKFTIVLAIMPLLVASVIMIVNGSLGTSVAVLGAFGLVRFRSAPGTSWEIVFLFFSMALGLALGMGFISLAIVIFVIVSIILVLLNLINYDSTTQKYRELKITIPEDLSYSGIFDDLFQQYTKRSNFRRVRTTNMGTMYELSYLVELRRPEDEKAFIDEIRCRNGNLTVMLGFVEKDRNLL